MALALFLFMFLFFNFVKGFISAWFPRGSSYPHLVTSSMAHSLLLWASLLLEAGPSSWSTSFLLSWASRNSLQWAFYTWLGLLMLLTQGTGYDPIINLILHFSFFPKAILNGIANELLVETVFWITSSPYFSPQNWVFLLAKIIEKDFISGQTMDIQALPHQVLENIYRRFYRSFGKTLSWRLKALRNINSRQ